MMILFYFKTDLFGGKPASGMGKASELFLRHDFLMIFSKGVTSAPKMKYFVI